MKVWRECKGVFWCKVGGSGWIAVVNESRCQVVMSTKIMHKGWGVEGGLVKREVLEGLGWKRKGGKGGRGRDLRMGQRRKKVRREKCEAGYEGREGRGGDRVGEEGFDQNQKKRWGGAERETGRGKQK